jgi:hypothetical protein
LEGPPNRPNGTIVWISVHTSQLKFRIVLGRSWQLEVQKHRQWAITIITALVGSGTLDVGKGNPLATAKAFSLTSTLPPTRD